LNSGIETKFLGGLWLLTKKIFKMDSCLRGTILNLTAISKNPFFDRKMAPWPTGPSAYTHLSIAAIM
jgi:hypothetical protein